MGSQSKYEKLLQDIRIQRQGLALHARKGFYMGDPRPQSHVSVSYILGIFDSLLVEQDEDQLALFEVDE